jgi:hypothetical protein
LAQDVSCILRHLTLKSKKFSFWFWLLHNFYIFVPRILYIKNEKVFLDGGGCGEHGVCLQGAE